MTSWTAALARTCAARPGRVVGLWAATLAAALVAVVLLLDGALSPESTYTADGDATSGYRLLGERLGSDSPLGGETVVVRSAGPASESLPAFAVRLAADLGSTGAARPVPTPWTGGSQEQLSADGRAVLLPVRLTDQDRWAEAVEPLLEVVAAADGDPRFSVTMTGPGTAARDFVTMSEADLARGEAFGLPAALLVLLLVFGTLVAGLLPLVLALVCVPVTLAVAAVLGQVWDLSLFLVNMVVAMGLALGVDYSLFVLSRFREERQRGAGLLEAVERAAGTAGTAVLFSGLSFVVALTGLLLVPDTVLRSLAAGAVVVGLVTAAAALTLVPALLSLLGDRFDALRVPLTHRARRTGEATESRVWETIVRAVMRRPVVTLALTAGVLLLAAAPALDLRTGTSGIGTLPEGSAARAGFLALEESFPASGRADPALVVVDGPVTDPRVAAGVEQVRQRVEADPRYGPVDVATHPSADLTVLTVSLPGDPVGTEAKEAVRALRADVVAPALGSTGARAWVTGTTAFEADYGDLIGRWLPVVIAFVLGLTFVLLTVVFRSVVLPLKAVLLNLLSVGAAYGLMVLVFQDGHGAELLGLTQVDAIDPWIPLFLFVVLFALSMDYHVLLLSRVREHWARSGSTVDAVATGIGSTARLITGAALIIVVVFSGFALGDVVGMQQMGFGVAAALLLDATVVRSLVVPASMALLGRWNWYLPSWLQWLPELQVEPGAAPEEDTPAAAPAPVPAAARASGQAGTLRPPGQRSAETAYARQVLDIVARIPAGRVLTYGDVARAHGRGSAATVSAVLREHGRGVPWHRVVQASGRPAETCLREALERLVAEGCPVAGGRVVLAAARWDGQRLPAARARL